MIKFLLLALVQMLMRVLSSPSALISSGDASLQFVTPIFWLCFPWTFLLLWPSRGFVTCIIPGLPSMFWKDVNKAWMLQIEYHGFAKTQLRGLVLKMLIILCTKSFHNSRLTSEFWHNSTNPVKYIGEVRTGRLIMDWSVRLSVMITRMLARRCLRLLTSTRPASLMQVYVGRGLYTDAFLTIDIFKDRRVSKQQAQKSR